MGESIVFSVVPTDISQGPQFIGFKKANVVYHTIKRAIILRELQPDEALIEQHIAAELGCSQGTVREALLRLQEDGLVVRRGYRGTVVSNTSLAEAAQMTLIRIGIETTGIHRSARTLTTEQLDDLSALLEQLNEASRIENTYARSELDRRFHLTILQHSGLAALEPILMRCALYMHRYTFGNGEEPEQSPVVSQHNALLDALKKRDPIRASQIVKDHIHSVVELWSPDLRRAMADGQQLSLD